MVDDLTHHVDLLVYVLDFGVISCRPEIHGLNYQSFYHCFLLPNRCSIYCQGNTIISVTRPPTKIKQEKKRREREREEREKRERNREKRGLAQWF